MKQEYIIYMKETYLISSAIVKVKIKSPSKGLDGVLLFLLMCDWTPKTLVQMICIWHPFKCDMGLDGTLTSHIKRVADELIWFVKSAI